MRETGLAPEPEGTDDEENVTLPYVSLRPSQVLLDPQNPRLPDGTTSDREAINRLLAEGPDALVNLARDMAQSGQSNPAELPIAIREGSKYLILEGNRRFAALKLLKDPRLASSETLQQAFRRAAALGTPPQSVYTLVVASRDEADRWIVLRHTGENNGRGTKRWSAGQAATYRSRANKTIDSGTMRSMVVFEELSSAYSDDSEIPMLLQDIRVAKFTNIGRFFSPEVLSRLRLHIHSDQINSVRVRTLWSNYTVEQMRDFFAEAMRFIKNQSVDAYKNGDKRKIIIDSLEYLLPNADTALANPVRVGANRGVDQDSYQDSDPSAESSASSERDEGDTEPSEGAKEAPEDVVGDQARRTDPATNNGSPASGSDDQNRRGAREARPEKYLFQGLKLPYHNKRIQQLMAEARTLEISSSPGVCCVMVRVIVELSVSSVEVLALSGRKEDDQLRKKIVGALTFLDPNIENPRQRDKELDQAYLEASELGFQYLNSFVHNPSVRPDEQLARRFSSAFRPLLARIDEALS